MSRGKRYEGDPQLNLKKVFGVLIAILVIVLFIIGIRKIIKADKKNLVSKNIPLYYYTVCTNGNWGVINSSGNTVIEPANGEMIIIPNKSKGVFLCTYEVNYVEGTYKTKAVNEKNQEIFTGYDNILALQNYDENKNMWYEDNVLKVQKDGKFGLINLDGKEVLPCEYDSIDTLKGVKNNLVVKKESKLGLVNSNGEVILDTLYEKIDNIVDNNKYIVKLDGTWLVIAKDGTKYLEGKVSNVAGMNNDNIIVINNGKYGIINLGEEEKVPYEYEELRYCFDNKYIAKKDGKYGVINLDKDVLVEFKYTNILHNYNTEYLKAQKENGAFDYISKDMAVKFTAGDESVISNNYIAVKVSGETKYYSLSLDEKANKDLFTTNTLFVYKDNGKYGFKNKDGKVVVEAKYEDATEQNDCGFVAVKKDGLWGALDQYGKVVCETKYNLDNNQTIDFIGKWHIGVGKNACYYTDAE